MMTSRVPAIPSRKTLEKFIDPQAFHPYQIPYLRHVFDEVMFKKRGYVEFDWQSDLFFMYLRIEHSDVEAVPEMKGMDDIWIAIAPDWKGDS